MECVSCGGTGEGFDWSSLNWRRVCVRRCLVWGPVLLMFLESRFSGEFIVWMAIVWDELCVRIG